MIKRMDYSEIEHNVNVLAACVVLHNICELEGDTSDPEWVHEEQSTAMEASTTTTHTNNAKVIRDALKDYLYVNQ